MPNTAIDELIEQIKNGFIYAEEDYYSSEYLRFGYDSAKQSFFIRRFDTIVGSYDKTEYCPESLIRSELERLL